MCFASPIHGLRHLGQVRQHIHHRKSRAESRVQMHVALMQRDLQGDDLGQRGKPQVADVYRVWGRNESKQR